MRQELSKTTAVLYSAFDNACSLTYMPRLSIERFRVKIRVFHHGLDDDEMHLLNIMAFSELCGGLYVSIV